jgi:cysteine desulfurase
VFTSGGTESNNLAIRGTAATADPARRRIVTSNVEHPATARPCDLLETQGWTITRLPVTGTGTLDPDTVIQALDTDVALLTMMLAQNETGAIMPVTAAATAARRSGTITHTDAAQAIGKIHVDVDSLGVDLLSIAGHKCYAPKGIGALYVRSGTPLQPLLLGGGQERGLRPGTEKRRLHRRSGSGLSPRADPRRHGVAAAAHPARPVVAEPVRADSGTGATYANGQQPAKHADGVLSRRPWP